MTLEEMIAKVRSAKRVFVIGNGGSYANAMHICNDLLLAGKSAFTLDPATLTAMSNDFGYQYAFERWIEIVGSPGDLLLALSGSGKSKNILRAVKQAKAMKIEVIEYYGAPLGLGMQDAEEDQLNFGHELWRQLKS